MRREEASILLLVGIHVFFEKRVSIWIWVVMTKYKLMVRIAMNDDRNRERGGKNVMRLGLIRGQGACE